MRHIWDGLLSENDRIVIEKGHYGKKRGLGKRPVLLLIDLQPNYVGANKPIGEQLDQYPSGAGESAWECLPRTLAMRDAAREAGVPVLYTRNVQQGTTLFDSFALKADRDHTRYLDGAPQADLLPCVKPLPGEMVISKGYASAFYGTALQSYLVKLQADTVIIAGGTTGGCCRATAVDAVTRNYNLGFVEDCLFDRIEVSHKIALLDIWMKYGDLVTSEEVKQYFSGL